MKNYIGNISLVFMMGLMSCEKVIDVSIKDAGQKYVIEAVVSDQAEGNFVKITTTQNLSDNNTFPGVGNADVKIADNDGNTFILNEKEAGIYKHNSFSGAIGKTYTLTVDIGGEIFKAVSTMPSKVKMDTLFITEEFLFGDVRKSANLVYRDPSGERNYYRFIQFINGRRFNQIFISNDEYTNGNRVTEKLRSPSDNEDDKIASGDTITVHALCIDKANNDYWTSYLTAGATGGSSTASPANPKTNIQGGALGYFSAHTVQVLETVVP